MKLDGIVYVVTGGCSGLGEATVRMAVENNAKVAIFDQNAKKAAPIIEELGADKVAFFKVNVTNDEDVAKAIAGVVEKFGRIDACVNCAGVGAAQATVSRSGKAHGAAAFSRVLDINLTGTFVVGARCAAQMATQEPNADGERGVIVNIASVAAMEGQNGQAAYAASKGGVVGMTLPMARDLGKFGIRVNCICPGIFDTALTGSKKPVENREVEEMKGTYKALLQAQVFPTKRFGRPSELAALVKTMTEVAFFNGETVRLDGAVRMPKL